MSRFHRARCMHTIGNFSCRMNANFGKSCRIKKFSIKIHQSHVNRALASNIRCECSINNKHAISSETVSLLLKHFVCWSAAYVIEWSSKNRIAIKIECERWNRLKKNQVVFHSWPWDVDQFCFCFVHLILSGQTPFSHWFRDTGQHQQMSNHLTSVFH